MLFFPKLLERIRLHRWPRSLVQLLPLAGVVALFVVTDLRGIDFGEQWDERQWHIDVTRDMVASGILLPRTYIYPSLTNLMVLAPSILAGRHSEMSSVQTWAACDVAKVRTSVQAPSGNFRCSKAD